ncbi:MAG: Rpn family recombination-promoting nuclease/putative transposase [Chloroflexota bacterium]
MARKKSQQQKKKEKAPTKPPTKESSRVQNPHDSFFRRVFSVLEHARQLIKGFLPSEMVAQMQLSTLIQLKETYMDEKLQQHMTDMLFRVSLHIEPDEPEQQPKSAEIYLLFDHKSHPESTIMEQFLRYMNERWQYDRENGLKPRVIIPIVFYHGSEGWHVKRQFADTFEDIDPMYHKFIPSFEYILINIGKTSDDDIMQLVNAGALQSGLLALKYIFNQGLESKLIQILKPLQKAKLPMETLRPWLEAMLRYLSGIKNPVSDEALDQAVRTVFAEEAEIMDTIFERLAERNRREGIVRGREEGIVRGRAEGILEGIEIGRQEAERQFQEEIDQIVEQKLERERQENLKKHRKSIVGVLNHILTLSEKDQAEVEVELEKIDDMDALYRLTNAALDASRNGFAYFMKKLILESRIGE